MARVSILASPTTKPSMATSRKGASIVKHSLMIAGHSTSISLEDAFWSCLGKTADQRGRSVAALVAEIDEGRGDANLSSAIRVFLLEAVVARVDQLGIRAGDQYRPAADGSTDTPGGEAPNGGV